MTFLRSIELDRALEFSGAYSRSEGRSILSVLRAAEFSHDQDPKRTVPTITAEWPNVAESGRSESPH